MAMMGLPKSPLPIPVARHSDREAAARSPLVVVSDLNGFIFEVSVFNSNGKRPVWWNRTTHSWLRGSVSG